MARIFKTLGELVRKPEPPKVLHHHIPKTAGTSFNGFLDSLYPNDTVMPKRWLPKAAKDPAIGGDRYGEAFRRFRLIHGHINLLPEVPSDWLTVTFLRPPVRRVVSLVSDWSRLEDADLEGLPAHNQEIKKKARTAAVADMIDIDAPLVRQHLRNGMCKSLISRLYSNSQIHRMSDEELVEAALEVLQTKVDFVGDAQNFDNSAGLFSREALDRPFKSKTANRSSASSRYERLNSEERVRIEQWNAADCQLYRRFVGYFGWTGAGGGLSEAFLTNKIN